MKYFFLFTLLLLITSNVFSSEFEDLLNKAIDGDIEAQFKVGMTYKYGKIVPKDINSSNDWLLRASQKDHAQAQLELAFNLFARRTPPGAGQEPNPEAIKWLNNASEMGILRAHLKLGQIYAHGWHGIKKDGKLARKYISKAAVEYQKNAINGSAEAQYLWGDILWQGYGKYVDGYDYTDDELDKEKGLRWLLKSAKQGNDDAMFLVGVIYHYMAFSNLPGWGQRLESLSNYNKAIQWYEKAADNGNADALQNLSYMYFDEDGGILLDPEKSFNFALKAALLGNEYSQFRVAQKYLKGEGVKQNIVKAYSWALVAKRNGHLDYKLDWPPESGRLIYPTTEFIIEMESLLAKEQINAARVFAIVCFESLYQNCK
jgi:TPR repeat protein